VLSFTGDPVGSKEESLQEEIRETVSSLSDQELSSMVSDRRQQFTEFARSVAREELRRRRGIKSAVSDRVGQPAGEAHEAISDSSNCYIEVWTQKNFEGEHLRIDGPIECSSLSVGGVNFSSSISSLRVGPMAFVLAYSDEEYRGAMASFGPGEEIPDLTELSFNDRIDSLRLINSLKIFDDARHDTPKSQLAAKLSSRSAKKKRSHRRLAASNR
jgi:hypothetical protein